jgi:hypothetical protein
MVDRRSPTRPDHVLEKFNDAYLIPSAMAAN